MLGKKPFFRLADPQEWVETWDGSKRSIIGQPNSVEIKAANCGSFGPIPKHLNFTPTPHPLIHLAKSPLITWSKLSVNMAGRNFVGN